MKYAGINKDDILKTYIYIRASAYMGPGHIKKKLQLLEIKTADQHDTQIPAHHPK